MFIVINCRCMENTEVRNETQTTKLSLILLGFTVFLLLVNLSAYGVSWYGRKPMTPEELRTGDKEKYSEQKQSWNTAVFYLLGISTFVTLIEMIIMMCQAWGMHKASKAENLKKKALEQTQTFL